MQQPGAEKEKPPELERSSSVSETGAFGCFGCCSFGRNEPASMKQTSARAVSEPKGAGGLVAPPLPSEWREVPDPAGSGDVYYWNIETDAVQWEHPTAGKALV